MKVMKISFAIAECSIQDSKGGEKPASYPALTPQQ